MPQASDYTGMAFSPGQTVWYSFNLDSSTLWAIGGWYAFQMSQSAYQAKVATALAQWSGVANITFQYTSNLSQADIGIYWHSTDGYGGTIGYALQYDADQDGVLEHGSDGVLIGMDPYDVATFDRAMLHEAGHAIGLDHNTHAYSVMAPYYGDMSPAITSYDAEVARSIYGSRGTAGSGTASGTSGADALVGSAAADTIYGGSGSDTIAAGDGADLLYGNLERDVISGDGGNDTIFGGQNDGPAGTDGIQRSGTEIVHGGAGNDLLYGNMGGDALRGDAGNDVLYGGQDNDALSGGAGDDMLFGNLGGDSFHYSSVAEGHDTIVGFDPATDWLVMNGVGVTSTVQVGDTVRMTMTSGTVIDFVGTDPADLTTASYLV